MAGLSHYSIDSSALIHGWRRAYRPNNFAAMWTRLDGLIAAGRLVASIEVLHELKRKDDDLHDWCKQRQENFFVDINDTVQIHVARIMAVHPRLVDTVKGRSGADPFVIALACVNTPKLVVVSEENPGKERIPDVCVSEKVRCIRLADLIEEENWRF